MSFKSEESLLKSWHLKLAILAGIITPSITGTAAYYGLKDQSAQDKGEMVEKVSALELKVTQNFADKDSLKRIDERTQKMQNDIVEIKTLLKSRHK